MSIVRVEANIHGPRLFIGPLRLHHFHLGAALIAFGVRLVWRDRADIHPRRRA